MASLTISPAADGVAFNVPFGDRAVSGSFDKTARLWHTGTVSLWFDRVLAMFRAMQLQVHPEPVYSRMTADA